MAHYVVNETICLYESHNILTAHNENKIKQGLISFQQIC